jgi:hypothetical protein
MRDTVYTVLAALGLAASVHGAQAGEMLSLHEKLQRSELILEVRLPLTQPIPERWPNRTYDPQGHGFPGALVEAARQAATIERVLKTSPEAGQAPELPATLHVFASNTPCWWKAHERGGLRTLVFLRREAGGAWQQVAGVEHESGLYSDLNPDYELLVAAITEAGAWVEERMRAVAAEMLWQQQRAALQSEDNVYLRHLAAGFLREHDSGDVIDPYWGHPGSEQRKANEQRARLPHQSVCRP